MAESTNPILQKINHFVVLMLENRSFDHLFGSLNKINPNIAGLTGEESCPDSYAAGASAKVRPATDFKMTFDPGHEFEDIQTQLYGLDPAHPGLPKPPANPAAMSGFIDSAYPAAQAVKPPADRLKVMEYFPPGALAVLSTLAQQFAVFNYWHSSLPGPPWPNRFFAHAGTSGGLTDSPDTGAILKGFAFQNGTIYDQLHQAGRSWRVYHDGTPQCIGIKSLRDEYLTPGTTHFSDWTDFDDDIWNNALPDYSFIEPRYNIGSQYVGGTSMHPLDDLRLGEQLVKDVYELIRQSPTYWNDTMIIIAFDEHGAFYDHVPPPLAVPTGDDVHYSNPEHPFAFDLLGVRVPAIVISAYTSANTVIGKDPKDPATRFDHASILKTVADRFSLPGLTQRDKQANSLAVALTLNAPRSDAPSVLTDPTQDVLAGATWAFVPGLPIPPAIG
jgi:phospholipase C